MSPNGVPSVPTETSYGKGTNFCQSVSHENVISVSYEYADLFGTYRRGRIKR